MADFMAEVSIESVYKYENWHKYIIYAFGCFQDILHFREQYVIIKEILF